MDQFMFQSGQSDFPERTICMNTRIKTKFINQWHPTRYNPVMDILYLEIKMDHKNVKQKRQYLHYHMYIIKLKSE